MTPLLLGFSEPLLFLLSRLLVWIYLPAAIFFLVGFHFLRDSVLVFLNRKDLNIKGRFLLSARALREAAISIAVGAAICFCLYHYSEIYQCVRHLF